MWPGNDNAPSSRQKKPAIRSGCGGLRADLPWLNATRNFSQVATQAAGPVTANQQLHALQQTCLRLSIPLSRIMLYVCRYVNCPIIANQSVTCDTNPARKAPYAMPDSGLLCFVAGADPGVSQYFKLILDICFKILNNKIIS